jgi:small subunit ribosomal protein S9
MATQTKQFYGTGRRKTSVARVWIFPGQKGFTINGREVESYLQRDSLNAVAHQALQAAAAAGTSETFRVRVNVAGGGLKGQAGAISMGIARAILEFNEKLRPELRKGGFLTRDSRQKERKKPGRRGARRRFQFTKR